jgi:hypothetical protein
MMKFWTSCNNAFGVTFLVHNSIITNFLFLLITSFAHHKRFGEVLPLSLVYVHVTQCMLLKISSGRYLLWLVFEIRNLGLLIAIFLLLSVYLLYACSVQGATNCWFLFLLRTTSEIGMLNVNSYFISVSYVVVSYIACALSCYQSDWP